MLWGRLVMVGFFSLTAISLLSFQSIEIVHALWHLIQDKNQLK
ncbi:hypothetical protein ACF5W4_10360 [Bacillota bacterium Lsc_1132]